MDGNLEIKNFLMENLMGFSDESYFFTKTLSSFNITATCIKIISINKYINKPL
jgi:hypothetical protein